MAEPTLALPHDALRSIRTVFATELLDLQQQIERVQSEIAHAQYGDVSKLGADRGRLGVAGRLLNEVACTLGDLTFRPGADSGEEG